MATRWSTRIILIAFSTCVGLVVGAIASEIALTAIAPHPATFPRGMYEPDPYIGWKGIPGKEMQYKKGQVASFIKINSHGFRDKERSPEKPTGVFRIVVLGDSFTAASQVLLEQTFPYLLETKLNTGTRNRFEVLNLGIDGFGTTQEYLTLTHYGLMYAPDLVVLAFFTGNDFTNNSLILQSQADGIRPGDNTSRPFVTLENRSLAPLPFAGAHRGPREAVQADATHESGPLRTVKEAVIGLLPNTCYWLIDAVHASPSATNVLWRLGIISTNVRPEVNNFTGCYRYAADYPPEWQEAWEITQALLLQMAGDLRARGIGFLVVVIPDEEELSPDLWNKEGCSTMPTIHADLGKPDRILSDFLKRNEISVLRLSPAFQKYYATGKRLYLPYRYDNHWNAAGHALAAEEIYSKLRDDGLIPRAGGG
jgi:SGNH hydrolase-like domain, acetyltransferase AlgX